MDIRKQDNSVVTVYKNILQDILAEKINIKTFSRRIRPEVEGLFAPPTYGDGPIIKVQRHRGGKSLTSNGAVSNFFSSVDEFLNDENVIHLERELLVLAHEFGHYKSYKSGQRPQGLDDACRLLGSQQIDEMMPYQKKIIVEEEETAWNNARKILDQKGYDRWRNFNSVQDEGLEAYRQLLKTPIMERKSWFVEGVTARTRQLPKDPKFEESIKQINKIYLESKNKKVFII